MKLNRWMRHGLALTSSMLFTLTSCGRPYNATADEGRLLFAPNGRSAADSNPTQKKVLLLSAIADQKADLAIELAAKAMTAQQVAYEHVAVTKDGNIQENLDLKLTGQDGKPRFSAVILTSDKLLFQNTEGKWVSGLGASQWKQLAEYETSQKTRRVALYAYPSIEAGMAPAGEPSGTPVKLVTAQDADAEVKDLTSINQASLANSWRYPAKVVNAALAKPVLMFQGAQAASQNESVAAALIRLQDGREQLQFYFSQSQTIQASVKLAPLWLNWAMPATQQTGAEAETLEGIWNSMFEGFDRFQGKFAFTREGEHYKMSGNLGPLVVAGPALTAGKDIAGGWSANNGDVLVASLDKQGATAEQGVSGRFVAGPDALVKGQFNIKGLSLKTPEGQWEFSGAADQTTPFTGTIEFSRSADDSDRFHVAVEIEGQKINGIALRTESGMALALAQNSNAGLYVHRLPESGMTEGRWVRIGQDATFSQKLTR